MQDSWSTGLGVEIPAGNITLMSLRWEVTCLRHSYCHLPIIHTAAQDIRPFSIPCCGVDRCDALRRWGARCLPPSVVTLAAVSTMVPLSSSPMVVFRI